LINLKEVQKIKTKDLFFQMISIKRQIKRSSLQKEESDE
jgi:hypothetical protein